MIEIPIRIVSTMNLREHWAVKAARAKKQRADVLYAMHGQPKPPLPVVVTLTRIAPRAVDSHDNLSAGMKHVVDALAQWMGIDDADVMVRWQYTQRKGPKPGYYACGVEFA